MKRRWYLKPWYLIFLLACVVVIVWATTGTFGLDSGTALGQNGGQLHASRFQNTVGTGTLTKLEIYFEDTTTESVRLGVYADTGAAPGALLLDAGVVAGAAGWVEISGLSLAVTNNLYYWLAFNLSDTATLSNLYPSEGPADSHKWIVTAYGALPNPFGSPDGSNPYQFVIRATVTTTNGATMINNILIIIGDEKKR